MRLLLQISILLLLTYSCSVNKELKIGEYINKKPNKIQQAKYLISGIQSYTIGDKLELNKDSTFMLVTCGNIEKGYWRKTTDSLYLFVTSNKLKNEFLTLGESDSTNIKGQINYRICRKGLIRIEKTKNNKKSINSLTINAP